MHKHKPHSVHRIDALPPENEDLTKRRYICQECGFLTYEELLLLHFRHKICK